MHKFDPANHRHLDGPERRSLLDPDLILSAAGIEKGSVIIEPGSGTGYFTIPLATQTGNKGRVYACDINPDLLTLTSQRAQEALRENVTTLLSQENHLPLQDALGDMVFLANVLHETVDKKAFLAECTRVLKPLGRVVVVEWELKNPPPGPPAEDRLGRDQTASLLAELGFTPEDPVPAGPHHYLLIAQRHPQRK